MKQIIKRIVVIFFLIYSLFFVVGSTLSPIFAYLKLYEYSAKCTEMYMNVCHQQPNMSFWILGYPIALCCRCYGFYIGVVLFGLVTLLNKFRLNVKTFLIMLIITMIDVTLNVILNINTGNITRFVAGLMMGTLFVSIINYIFEYEKENSDAS